MPTGTVRVLRSEKRFDVTLPTAGHRIGGKTVADGPGSVAAFDPARGTELTTIPLGDGDTVDHAVRVARAAFDGWRARTPRDRASHLLALATL